ncbi:MAG TPA: phage holin family protein [Tissierellaceae bacterium]|nr:phage holin family protein [Tissierellaceae bacterium]
MDIGGYLIEEALIMIPVLYILGNFLKSLEGFKDKYIPIILLVVSIFFTPLVIGKFNADNVVQGILVAGTTVFANQVYKQSRRDE